MPTNSYDLIVIGEDLAGLIAATLCAKRGLRTLILSHGAGPYGYNIGPYQLPVEPLALCGLQSPAIKRVVSELHLTHTLKRKLVERKVSFQFVAPNIRFDASAHEADLTSELQRELKDYQRALEICASAGQVSDQLDVVLGSHREFPPSGFWKKREVGKSAVKLSDDAERWLEACRADSTLQALVELPALLGTHTGLHTVSPAALARAFHLWRQGTPRLQGDFSTLREIFLDKLHQANGETRQAKVAEMSMSWGRVNGVKLDNGEELGAKHVIAALPVDALLSLFAAKAPKRLAKIAESLSISGYRYTLNMIVNEAGIPEGMSSPVLVTAEPDQPLTADNAIAIFLDTPDDAAQVAVSVVAICPPPDEGESLDDVFADLRVRLRERIEMVMPFFSEHVLLAHAPCESAPPEGINADPGRDIPADPTPIWTSDLDAAMGVSAVPYSIGVKHLTMASNQVLPQLGVEGSFAAGWCAAKIACDATGKKRDYLKDEVLANN